MDKPSKCKNCQWYGKPYWSIINPCDNCPMENVETFTRWIDPTIEKQKKEIDRLNNDIKILLKENEAKEKVIKKQDYVINELEKWAKSIQLTVYRSDDMPVYQRQDVLDKLKELKEKNNER